MRGAAIARRKLTAAWGWPSANSDVCSIRVTRQSLSAAKRAVRAWQTPKNRAQQRHASYTRKPGVIKSRSCAAENKLKGIAMHKLRSTLLAPLALVLMSFASLAAFSQTPARVTTAATNIKHVFLILLENKNFSDTFETSTQDPYLRKTLVPMGALLTEYYGTGHVSLDNYIALISGQAPTPDTDNDCLVRPRGALYIDVQQTGTTPDGQVIAAHGCIYPAQVKTLADQLDAAGYDWKGYMEDMGNDPARESATCGHPRVGGPDDTSSAEAPSAAVPLGDAYATRHNPFMYFHSIIDSPRCKTHVVNLNKLPADLKEVRTTPNFSLITPNLCNDAHDGGGTGARGRGCANGDPGGLTSADAFLQRWVPKILASPAYRQDGLLIITFDESASAVSQHVDEKTRKRIVDVTFSGKTCCRQQRGPNLENARPGSVVLSESEKALVRWVFDGYGGDRIGALLLSPFAKPGSKSNTPYNHYSMLRSLEDIFALDGY
ncbi:MAG TPA: alkaline phosphatase family protein, partial [Gammaproteobacteria bacterium]|nr:alkaline phosphatase family protein [Gammaproteobacteria bacterium]